MENQQLLISLLFGGLLGMIGQGIRIIIGLKKLNEEAASQATDGTKSAKEFLKEEFDSKRLWISVFIGFLAGSLASFTQKESAYTPEVQMAIIAAGYSGADFIEGLFRKYL